MSALRASPPAGRPRWNRRPGSKRHQPHQSRQSLRRSATDKVLGGVCGGLAEDSGVEPMLWRVGFIALALFGPGIVSYPLLWVVMPPDPGGPDDSSNSSFTQRLRKGLTPTHTDS
jgi:phage shock protein PspC (stress-responsive transcriptional regulator)